MKRIEPDKDNHVVWGTENFMERSFIYLQDDYPPSLNISRCMECYGQRFGLEHLQTYLRELGDHPVLKIPLQFFWETPTSNPKVKEELEKRGYTYNDK